MNVLRNESGQTLVFVALSLTCVLGFVGLATDVGSLLHAKRDLQIAADSAAIAGASELTFSVVTTDVTTAAQAAATQNFVTNGTNGTTVAVNDPPLGGPNAGKAGYVEVIVSQPQPVFFMQLFNWNTMTVAARAVAFNGASGKACVYILNPTASDAMQLQGSFTVSVPSCGVVIDSNSSTALQFTGAGGTLTAQSIGVVGGDSGQTGDSTPPPVTGVAPESDPLASVPAPTYNPASCTPPPASGNWGPATVGGTVCYSGNVSIGTTTLNPGVYVFTGNVSFSGTVTGTGVTLYLLGNLDASNGTLTLTAPQTGNADCPAPCTYNGLLIFAARNDAGLLTFDKGSASGTLTGIIYAPDAEMELHDSGGDKNGGLQLDTDLIVNTLYDQTATLSLTSYTQSTSTSPLHSVALVE